MAQSPDTGEPLDPPEDERARDPDVAEADAAASEAREIGRRTGEEELDPEDRPIIEAGEGESEGFDEAERLLTEHASHGDEQSAHWVLHHQGRPEEPASADYAEPDHEHSSEVDDSEGARDVFER
jgi:hypothetical protein